MTLQPMAADLARIETVPDTAAGLILVRLVDIPAGFDRAIITRTLDGATTEMGTFAVVGDVVEVADYAAAPGWTVTYAATLEADRGLNVATNPGFESGDFTTAWETVGDEAFSDGGFETEGTSWNPQGGASLARTGDMARSGGWSMRVTPGTNVWPRMSQASVPIVGGAPHLMAGWLYLTVPVTEARLAIRWADQADTDLGLDVLPQTAPAVGAWTRIEQIFTAPATAVSGTAHVGLWDQAMDPSKVFYVDDLSLVQVQQADTWHATDAVAHTRDDGAAHTGRYQARVTVEDGTGLVEAAKAAMVPGAVTGDDFNQYASQATGPVSDNDADYVRTTITVATSSANVAYTGRLPVEPGQALFATATVRAAGSLTGSTWLQVQFFDNTDSFLATHNLGTASPADGWHARSGVTDPAPDGTVYALLTVQAGGFGASWSPGNTLDVAYLQAWADAAALPADPAAVWQDVDADPGTQYQAQVWARCPPLPTATHARLDMAPVANGSPGQPVSSEPEPVTGRWTRLDAPPLTMPDGADGLRLSVVPLADQNGTPAQAGRRLDVDDLWVGDTAGYATDVDAATDQLPATRPGDAWLKDPADPSKAMRVWVSQLPQLTRAGRVGSHTVAGRARPVTVSDIRTSATGDLAVYTLTDAQLDQILELLMPGSVLLFQTVPDALLPAEMYLAVDDAVEARLDNATVTDPQRLHTLSFTVVDPPHVPTGVAPSANSYADLAEYGETYRHVADTRATYLDVLQTSFAPAGAS